MSAPLKPTTRVLSGVPAFGLGVLVLTAMWATTGAVSLPHAVAAPVVAPGPGYLEPNQGQLPDGVLFRAAHATGAAYLRAGGAVFAVVAGSEEQPPLVGAPAGARGLGATEARRGWSVDMSFVGAAPVSVLPGDRVAGVSHYYPSRDASTWVTGIPHFRTVTMAEAYPGIDIVWHFTAEGALKYDVVVKPGADPSKVRIQYNGATLQVATGRLDALTPLGAIASGEPVSYQTGPGGRRVAVAAHYEDLGGNVARVAVGDYDPQRTLIIDPIIWSTYLGGQDTDYVLGVAPAPNLGTFAAGVTWSPTFPVTAGSWSGGANMAFVTHFDSGGNVLYSTYLGGSSMQGARGIDADAAGYAVITGTTDSYDFPITTGPAWGGAPAYSFAAQLDPGGALTYARFLSGGMTASCNAQGVGVAVDAAGAAYVVGAALPGFPTTFGAFQTTYPGGSCAGFLAKLDFWGNIVFGTYLGGSTQMTVAMGVDVDGAGRAHVTGYTTSTSYPTTLGAYQMFHPGAGAFAAFVTKLNAAGSVPIYSTFLAGTTLTGALPSVGMSIAVDPAGNAYMGGYSGALDYPTTPTAAQPTNPGGWATGVLSKLNPLGNLLLYSTFAGGSAGDFAQGVAVEAGGVAYLTGGTSSTDLPTTTGAIQLTNPGGASAFVGRYDTTATPPVYGLTYLGGGAADQGSGIAKISASVVSVGGITSSTNFPVTPGAFQPSYPGGSASGFVTVLKIVPGTPVPPPPPPPPPPPTMRQGAAGATMPTFLGPDAFISSHGVIGLSATADAGYYDTTTSTWNVLPSAGVARSGLAGTTDGWGTHYFAIGGVGPSCAGPGSSCDTVEVFDGTTWSAYPPLNQARAGFGATMKLDFPDLVYVFGGRQCASPACGSPLSSMEIYDNLAGTWTVGPSMPTAREDLAVAAAPMGSCKIAIIGGNSGPSTPDMASIDVYEPCANVWIPGYIPSMPTPVSNAVAGWCNGFLHVVGGTNGGTPTNLVQKWMGGTTWTTTPVTIPGGIQKATSQVSFDPAASLIIVTDGYNEPVALIPC